MCKRNKAVGIRDENQNPNTLGFHGTEVGVSSIFKRVLDVVSNLPGKKNDVPNENLELHSTKNNIGVTGIHQ